MTTQLTDVYEFDRLPIEPIPAGTNVLVTGPPLVGTQQLLFELVSATDDEGMIFISVDEDGASIVEGYEASSGTFDPGRMCVIDCSEHGTDAAGSSRQVGSPSDLTGIGIEFSSLYETLHGNGFDRTRVGLYSIPTLLAFADDFRSVFRFLHTVTSRIRTADGLGLFAIDPDAVDDEAFATIAQAFDARLNVREGADCPEFRVHGLPDQPDGWHAV